MSERVSAFITSVIGWPFELPRKWRRVFVILLPVTVPIWVLGFLVIGCPTIIFWMFREMFIELWGSE